MPARARHDAFGGNPAMPRFATDGDVARIAKQEAQVGAAFFAMQAKRPVLIVGGESVILRPSLADDVKVLAFANLLGQKNPGFDRDGVARIGMPSGFFPSAELLLTWTKPSCHCKCAPPCSSAAQNREIRLAVAVRRRFEFQRSLLKVVERSHFGRRGVPRVGSDLIAGLLPSNASDATIGWSFNINDE